MKNKNFKFNIIIITLAFCSIAINSCKKEKEKSNSTNGSIPVIATNEVSNIKQTSVVCGGVISSDGNSLVTSKGLCWSNDSNPNISDSITNNGLGAGSFSCTISGLVPSTTYYIRAYASNTNGTSYGTEKVFTTKKDTIHDIEGNVYHIVYIGTQSWLAENLRTTKFNNGTQITNITNINDWHNSSANAYCWYDNDSISNASVYGALYNWHTVESGNVCPSGWHVPSYQEWNTLINAQGSNANCNLKATGTLVSGDGLWLFPNYANNITGFSALPAGYIGSWGFAGLSGHARWWSTSEIYSYGVLCTVITTMLNDECYKNIEADSQSRGFSIRCIQDSL
jgi:uncharacterized protein (TIGR02145 family)